MIEIYLSNFPWRCWGDKVGWGLLQQDLVVGHLWHPVQVPAEVSVGPHPVKVVDFFGDHGEHGVHGQEGLQGGGAALFGTSNDDIGKSQLSATIFFKKKRSLFKIS